MGLVGSSLLQWKTDAVWLWKAGDDPWSETNDQWNQYSDPQIYMIEEAFQNKRSNVELDNYLIDLKRFLQVNRSNTHQQRPIKRIPVTNENIRIRATERFLLQETAITPKSFSPVGIWGWSKFLSAAGFRARISEAELPDRVEAAACGILEEGKRINQKKDARWMAQHLKALKHKKASEIGAGCVRLYTLESFLYKQVNTVMREVKTQKKAGADDAYEFVNEEDQIYGRTLGPFCSLLLVYLWENLSHREVIVYRAANLTEAMIDDYKTHINEFVEWDGFSSTTTSLEKAKHYSTNVIFRIQIPRGPHPSVDIKTLSEYPDEEEVLLPAGTWVKITNVNYDTELGTTIIDLIK